MPSSITLRHKLRFERFKNLILLNVFQGAAFSLSENIPHKTFLNSIPKSGTNLLIKTVQLLPKIHNSTISLHSEMYGTPWQPNLPLRQRFWRCFPSVNTSYNLAKLAKTEFNMSDKFDNLIPIGGFHHVFIPQEQLHELLSMTPEGWYVDGHIPFSKAFERLLHLENFKMVLIIRDPRDIITSEINYFLSENQLSLHPYYKEIGHEQGMISIIKGFYDERGAFPRQPSFRNILTEYLPWLSKSYVYLTRFEDLVGPQGGGTRETQINQIMGISKHLKIHISEAEAINIGHNVFGGTHTFHRGIVGSWKEAFSQEVKTICKNHIGDLLIELGYEKDYDW